MKTSMNYSPYEINASFYIRHPVTIEASAAEDLLDVPKPVLLVAKEALEKAGLKFIETQPALPSEAFLFVDLNYVCICDGEALDTIEFGINLRQELIGGDNTALVASVLKQRALLRLGDLLKTLEPSEQSEAA